MKPAAFVLLLSAVCIARNCVSADNLLGWWHSDSSFEEVARLKVISGDTVSRVQKDTIAPLWHEHVAKGTLWFFDADSVEMRAEFDPPDTVTGIIVIELRCSYSIVGDSINWVCSTLGREMNGAVFRDGFLVALDLEDTSATEHGDTTDIVLMRTYTVYSGPGMTPIQFRTTAATRPKLSGRNPHLTIFSRRPLDALPRGMWLDLGGRQRVAEGAAGAFVQRALRR